MFPKNTTLIKVIKICSKLEQIRNNLSLCFKQHYQNLESLLNKVFLMNQNNSLKKRLTNTRSSHIKAQRTTQKVIKSKQKY